MAKGKGKTGRPAKIGEREKEIIQTTLAAGGSVSDAAALIGVNTSTIRKLRMRDRTFAHGMLQSVATGKIALIQRINEAPDWKAAAWMLERKWGKEYGRREPVKIEHTGKDGGPIQTQGEVKHAVDYDAIERELAAIRVARRVPSDN